MSEQEVVPAKTSPDWHNFVMSKFDRETEVDAEGNPGVDALRRVCELVLGPIIFARADVIKAVEADNINSVCSYTLKVQTPGQLLEITEVADCSPFNADPKYAIFATALAATRAEARALRKLLRLRKIVSQEEISDVPVEAAGFASGAINGQQMATIKSLAKQANVNIKKYAKHKFKQELDNLLFSDGGKMIQELNKYRNYRESVPAAIIGYVEN